MVDFHGINVLAKHPLFEKTSVAKELTSMPLGFIDVGARGGMHHMVNPLAQLTAVMGFEPDEEECTRLLAISEVTNRWAHFQLEPKALAACHKLAELKLISSPTNHSLLSPNKQITERYGMEKWQEVGSMPMPTETLDSVLAEQNNAYPWGEFIKLDTQGTEYDVLLGAEKTLKEKTVALVVEVAFCELYKDQKLFSEVELLLRDKGFSFYGFMPMHTRSQKYLNKKTHITRERAFYADAVFLKDPLSSDVRLTERQEKIVFVTSLLLGYYDFALELAKATWLKKSSLEESRLIQSLIEAIASFPIEKTIKKVSHLAESVAASAEDANVLVGSFVDARRWRCDYDDILNVSPLPETY